MSSFTVTPSLSFGPNGEEIVDYDNGFVDSSNYRQQVREAFNRDNSFDASLYYERPDGSIGHRYADLDGDVYQTYEQDFVEDLDAEEYLAEADITQEDAEYLTNLVGGAEAYETMLQWAAMNMPQSFQDDFDAVLQSADVGDIQEVIEALYEAWTNNRTDDDEYITYDNSYDEDDDEQYEGDTDLSDEFVHGLWESVGGHGAYQDLIAWAGETLPDEEIEAFDYLIEVGDQQAIAQAVATLHEMYINY